MITGFENSHNMYLNNREMAVETVSRGVILPLKETEKGPRWGLGGVCDESGTFVKLSSYDGGWATHGGIYPYAEADYIDCDVVYFGPFFKHWGHFLVDLMGRLWYYASKASSDNLPKLAYIGSEEPSGNFLEIFTLLGLSADDLIHVVSPTRFRNVIVPQFACRSCDWYSSEYASIFDTMIRKVKDEKYMPDQLANTKKIYFSRLAFGKAQNSEFGENNIVKWLEANGFTSVAPEKLSVKDQIYIWNNAEEIACLDGSIPLSLAFSNNPQLKLTILHKTSLEHLNVELYLLMRPCDVALLDVWHEPFKGYPKNIGAGPFLLHLGEDAKEYSQLRNWIFPFTNKDLTVDKIKNTAKLAWRIVNLDGKLRILASKLLPSSVKGLIRRVLHG